VGKTPVTNSTNNRYPLIIIDKHTNTRYYVRTYTINIGAAKMRVFFGTSTVIGTNKFRTPTNPLHTKEFSSFSEFAEYVITGTPTTITNSEFHKLPIDEYKSLKNGDYFIASVMKENTRAKVPDNVQHAQMVVIDVDEAIPAQKFLEQLQSNNIPESITHLEMFYHETTGSRTEHRKIHLIINKQTEVGRYPGTVKAITQAFGLDLKDIDDRSIKQPWFIPVIFPNNPTFSGYIPATTSPPEVDTLYIAPPPKQELVITKPDNIDDEKIKSALDAIPVDIPHGLSENGCYETTCTVGFGLRHQYQDDVEKGRELMQYYANRWSEEGEEVLSRYDTSSPTAASGTPKTIKGVFALARKHGWVEKYTLMDEFDKLNGGDDLDVERAIVWGATFKTGAPKNNINNYRRLLASYGVTVRYNTLKKNIEINIPDKIFPVENATKQAMEALHSCCVTNNLSTKDFYMRMGSIASENTYNPVADWIDEVEWDGKDRIQALTDTLKPVNPPLAYILLRRWLLSAVCAAFNKNGVKAQGVLTIQGKQGKGKTTWMKRLLPETHNDWVSTEASINTKCKDSVKQNTVYWIVEWAELETTFKAADISALRSYITRSEDDLRAVYATLSTVHLRRTVYAASVNNPQFLKDPEGNRRFWVIATQGKLDSRHNIDMQQVYAQVRVLWEGGEQIDLTPEESSMLKKNNKHHNEVSPIEEKLEKCFDFQNMKRYTYYHDYKNTEPLTLTEIAKRIEIFNPSKQTSREISSTLRIKYNMESRKTNGRMVFDMPKPQQENI